MESGRRIWRCEDGDTMKEEKAIERGGGQGGERQDILRRAEKGEYGDKMQELTDGEKK